MAYYWHRNGSILLCYCDVEFYVQMFGHSYPAITQRVELTGYHNTKF